MTFNLTFYNNTLNEKIELEGIAYFETWANRDKTAIVVGFPDDTEAEFKDVEIYGARE